MPGKYVYVRMKKTKPGQPGFWSEKKRLETVTTYLSTGNVTLTAALQNIPRDTLKTWMKQDWWAERCAEIKSQETKQLDTKLEKIVEKSLEYVSDRLENGDPMYDPRTGKVIRVPARLRDIHKVSMDMMDRRMMIQKNQEHKEHQEKQSVQQDHLIQLAKAFAEFATGKKPIETPPEIIEGEFTEHLDAAGLELTRNQENTDALHEEGERKISS